MTSLQNTSCTKGKRLEIMFKFGEINFKQNDGMSVTVDNRIIRYCSIENPLC